MADNPNMLARLRDALFAPAPQPAIAQLGRKDASFGVWQPTDPTQVISVRTGRNFPAAIAEGYKRNEIIYACVYKKAQALTGVKIRVEKENTEEEIENHPLKLLLERPNPYWSWEDLIASISIVQDAAGIAYFQKVRARSGGVVQLWPMRPDWVKPQLNSNGLQGYLYELPGKAPIPFKAQDVMSLRLYDPMNMYGGTAPISVLGHAGDIDNAMSSYMRRFFLEGGIPMFALSTDQVMVGEQDIQTVRAGFRNRYGGHDNWIEPVVLPAGLKLERINMSFADLGFDAVDGRNEARICAVLGVPPIIIGAKIGLDRSTFANYAEARTAWWEDDLHPKLRFLRGQLSRDLVPEFGEGIEIEWDLSDIPAFQDDQNEVWTRALEHLKGGGVLVDEYRQMIGLEPLENDLGQIFLRDMRMTEVPLGEIGEPTRSTVTEQPAANSGQAVQPASEVVPGDAGNATPAQKAVWPYDEKAAVAADAPDAKLRRKHEQQFADELTTYFDEFRKRVAKQHRLMATATVLLGQRGRSALCHHLPEHRSQCHGRRPGRRR